MGGGRRRPGRARRIKDRDASPSFAPMDAPARRISWISPPPEICTLCKEPLDHPDETSSWNGSPAHRDCVRVHLLQRDPAFRESSEATEPSDDAGESLDGVLPRDDDESDFD